jgi:hypothetical protein
LVVEDEKISDRHDVAGKGLIDMVLMQELLESTAAVGSHRFERGDGSAVTHDREPFPPVFHGVENVSKAAGRVSRRDLVHENQTI